MRFLNEPNAKFNFCTLGLCRYFLTLGSVLCCLPHFLFSPAIAGAWVNHPGQIKLFLTQQTTREKVEKSPFPSPFRDIRNITENHAYIEYGWHPDITLTGNIVVSDHQTGRTNQTTSRSSSSTSERVLNRTRELLVESLNVNNSGSDLVFMYRLSGAKLLFKRNTL